MRLKGVMDEKTFARFAASEQERSAMDEEIRKKFHIPSNRYYTVTLPPSPAGRVFLDESRKRELHTPKLSKSAS